MLTTNYEYLKLKDIVFTYNFTIIPKGSGYIKSREKDAILSKRSVLRIINDDNNCFWYALSCLVNPKNSSIRDHRNILARQKAGIELCKKCKLNWGDPVSMLSLPIVETMLDCNVYVLNIDNIPILGSTIKLWNCLIYKSENKNKEHYFLLYDEVNKHYDCITDI